MSGLNRKMTMAKKNSSLRKYPIVVPGVGPVPAPGMIIGEAPGRKEIEYGIPFCGRSGALLDDALVGGGATRSRYYITNCFKGDVGVGNRNPTEDELHAHRDILRREIEDVRPLGVLLLGRVAVQTFIPEVIRLGDWVSERVRIGGIYYCPCWHPAYVLRNATKRDEFYECIAAFIEGT